MTVRVLRFRVQKRQGQLAQLRRASVVPWKEQQTVDQRLAFVMAYMKGNASMAELCREFSVSRKTGYKWLQRFLDGGVPNLVLRPKSRDAFGFYTWSTRPV